jgi:hypothetical protein
MNKMRSNHIIRTVACFVLAGTLVVGLGSASVLGPIPFLPNGPIYRLDNGATAALTDLNRLGLLQHIPQTSLEDLLQFQKTSGKSLAQIFKDPMWAKKLGFNATPFKATWYAANPFDLLPTDIQVALQRTKDPLYTRKDLKAWCKMNKAPERWHQAFKVALVETTVYNLWRASKGLSSVVRNGEAIQPIVVERPRDIIEVFDGHIATDPAVIPTNSIVYILVKIEGKDRLLKVKAADTGEAIRGKHIDLPIHFRPRPNKILPYIRFPKEKISNPTVLILTPAPKKS